MIYNIYNVVYIYIYMEHYATMHKFSYISTYHRILWMISVDWKRRQCQALLANVGVPELQACNLAIEMSIFF